MSHATGAGCKLSNKQLQDEVEHLKQVGSELLAGSKSTSLIIEKPSGELDPAPDLEFLMNPVSTVLYNRALPYRSSEFSEVLRHNNAYLKLERQELNFEKEVFFKRRFRILLKSTLNNSDKRYKLLKTVAFFKLIASSVFIGKDIYGGIGVGGGFGYKTSVPEQTRSHIEGFYN